MECEVVGSNPPPLALTLIVLTLTLRRDTLLSGGERPMAAVCRDESGDPQCCDLNYASLRELNPVSYHDPHPCASSTLSLTMNLTPARAQRCLLP